MQMLGMAVLIVLALIGAYSLAVGVLSLFLSRGKGNDDAVVVLEGHREDAEYLLRSALFFSNGTVTVVEKDTDEQTREIARRMAEDHRRIKIAEV